MKQRSALLFQAVIVIIGIGTLAFLLGEPHIEGRNVDATLFEIYFHDPFLAYAYIASIPFFVLLYQAFMLLRLAARGTAFSPATRNALRTIRYCAISMIGFVVVGEMFILSTSEDHPPAVVMGLLITVASIVIATSAAKLEKKWSTERSK